MKNKREVAEELWDEHSVLLDSDIDNLSYYSGREMMTEQEFHKAMLSYTQSSPPCQCERYREVLEKIIEIQKDDWNVMNLSPTNLIVMINDIVTEALADGGKEGDGWIRVEDGLPDRGGHYIAAYYNPTDKYKKLYVVTVYRGRGSWYWDIAEKEPAEDATLTVTHWRPLPPAPQTK